MINQERKKVTLALCISTYIMAYLCRLNFSSAVLKISEAMDVTTATMGAVGSLFFIAYALGQLFNGFLGDRLSPTKFIIFAILGTGGVNLLMTTADSIWAIRILWILNGYFQSVFWATCNGLLSRYYGKEEHHIVSTGMSLSMVVSYVLSWAILGKVLVASSWQSYFLIPAFAAGGMLLLWFLFARFEKVTAEKGEVRVTLTPKELFSTIMEERLWLLCLTCIFTGLVKEGIGLWAPVIFLTILGGNINQSLLFIVVIPLGNFLGIMLTERLLRKKNARAYNILKAMLFTMSLCALSILLVKDILSYGAVFFTAAVSAMALGCNSILLSYIPLSYSEKNIVSSLIGLFNFSAYIGAAVSAYVLGVFLNHGNWQIIPVFWMVAGIIGTIFVSILHRRQTHRQ